MKLIKLLFLLVCFTSCIAHNEPEDIGKAEITFTYIVPEDLFKYVEITVCYNENNDTKWEPMLDSTHIIKYDVNKSLATAPVVLIYKPTNRPAYGISVDWDIIMHTEVQIDGITYVHKSVYNINGDLGEGINTIINDVHKRTHAVKIINSSIQFI